MARSVVFVQLAALGAVLIAFASPAAAGITGVTTNMPSPTFNGSCPASMVVDGAIAGAKATSVTYNFLYYDPASKKTIALPTGAGSIPGSGILTLTTTLSIGSAHAGASWVQLQAKSGVQSLSSNKTAFSVTCTTSTPPPSQGSKNFASLGVLHPITTLTNQFFVDVPTALHSTLAQQDCSAHGGFAGGLACTAGLPQGMLALVWDFCSGCKADGFHVYRVDGGHHDQISIPANGTSVTLALLDVPKDGFAGKCYAVAAYRGSLESALSKVFCVGVGGSTVATVMLAPIHERSSEAQASWNPTPMFGCAGGNWTHKENDPDGLWVGYYHSVWQIWNETPFGVPIPCHDWDNQLDRGALSFDVSSLQGKRIYLAYLHLIVDTTQIYDYGKTGPIDVSHYLTDHVTSCASRVGLGQNNWWNYTSWIPTTPTFYIAERQGPSVAYDVTDAVRFLVNSTYNFGFVLTGNYSLDSSANPNLGGAETNLNNVPLMCRTHYSDAITLEVKYS